jgi:glutaminyl-peptide cyclotransferase
LFESTGDYGHSSVREVDPQSGQVIRQVDLPDDDFGEGLALVGDELLQLTWRDGIAYVWNAGTFAPLGRFEYPGEGWGLCHDGSRLIMSDGSDHLTFRDDQTFEVIGTVDVTLAGEPRDQLNELECVDGLVWANVWGTDLIVRIDPASGVIDGVLDLTGIIDPDPRASDSGAVLNGVAHDPNAGTFLVTGKHWPELFEIRLTEGD